MTKDEVLARLAECAKSDDTEYAHFDADEVLCEFLTSLGHQDVVLAYEKVSKWYS